MRILRLLAGVFLIALWALPARAAATDVGLIVSANTVRPGDTVLAGVRLTMQPGWHIYWRNPGGSGIATSIQWQLPAGVTAGEIQWPVPHTLPEDELTTFIYENEVMLFVPLTFAKDIAKGPVNLKATIGWLECKTACVPGHGDVQTSITVGDEDNASTDAFVLQSWQQKLPLSGSNLIANASWEPATATNSRPLVIEWNSPSNAGADFYSYGSDNFTVQFARELLPADSGKVRLRKTIKKTDGDWPQHLAGLLVQTSGTNLVAHEVDIPISQASPTAATTPGIASAPILAPTRSLAEILLYAFIGGLILNIMPCVLPVIALKILGFVNQGREHPGAVRKLGLVYGAGVLFSFLILAATVIAVKEAGHQAGWGMQFGSPKFIVIMTVLVTLVALNLFGIFEINLSGKVMGAAGNLSAKDGTAGAFFNGVLATVLATPCSAPFLGVALGFAFSQSYAIIVAVFLTVGLGLALPYIILSWNPALLRLLPRPGMWMEKFKIAMGFPMLATAVWLFDLTTVHYGRRVLWLALFLVMVALAAWIYGEFVQRGRTRKGLALAMVLLILTGGYVYALEGQLHWRMPIADDGAMALSNDPNGIDWKPWSPEAITAARAAGHPVMVDFTADWCQVCQVNRKTSIEITRVEDKLKRTGTIALVADYTKLPENMTKELARFGRAAVPLVLVYPANPELPPEILPDGYLTPGIVLAALDKASAKVTAMP